MATYHQSDLSAWSRCSAQVGYQRAGLPSKTNSAAAYGSVMHHAVLVVLERQLAQGVAFEQAVAASVDTFLHYWSPAHIEDITEPVPADGWLPGYKYSDLRSKGVEAIRQYADLIRFDETERLATEFNFNVAIEGTWDEALGEPHRLAGSIDRLGARFYSRKPVVAVDDLKTGRDYPGLRHNIQFSAYCFATTQLSFWTGDRGEDGFGVERGTELYQRFLHAGRRGTWISIKQMKFLDAGWRGPTDYSRFALAIEQMHASIQADIFPLSISGAVCTYCFTGDTRAWTQNGLRRLDDLAGTTPHLLVNTGNAGEWVEAPVRSFGQAPVLAVNLARGRDTKTIRATADHRWLVRQRAHGKPVEVTTDSLVHGQRLATLSTHPRITKVTVSPFGAAAGLVYGDGSLEHAGGGTGRIDLWGAKISLLPYFNGCKATPVTTAKGVTGMHVSGLPRAFKMRPDLSEHAGYLYGWLAGYFAADGSVSAEGQISLSSANEADLAFAQIVATRLGIFTHEIHGYERVGITDKISTLFKLGFAADSLRADFFLREEHLANYRPDVVSQRSWSVVSVEQAGVAEVFCATVEGHENFVLEGFINVKNCDYRAICGGTGLADADHGNPRHAV